MCTPVLTTGMNFHEYTHVTLAYLLNSYSFCTQELLRKSRFECVKDSSYTIVNIRGTISSPSWYVIY